MKKWLFIVPGLTFGILGAAALANYLGGGTATTTATRPAPKPASASCQQTQATLFKQLSADGWASADGSNFSFTCNDDGSDITGEYRLGKSYVAVRAQSTNPAETIETRPLGTNRTGANNPDVEWQDF